MIIIIDQVYFLIYFQDQFEVIKLFINSQNHHVVSFLLENY